MLKLRAATITGIPFSVGDDFLPMVSANNLRIMVVDDDREMLELVESVLRQLGYQEIAPRIGADEAWHDLPRFQPELLIVDAVMTPIDGLELTRRIRAGDETIPREVPVILLTGQPRAEEIHAALQAGVTQVLIKPITARALHDRIAALAIPASESHIQNCA